jgi:hypothetical protein
MSVGLTIYNCCGDEWWVGDHRVVYNSMHNMYMVDCIDFWYWTATLCRALNIAYGLATGILQISPAHYSPYKITWPVLKWSKRYESC